MQPTFLANQNCGKWYSMYYPEKVCNGDKWQHMKWVVIKKVINLHDSDPLKIFSWGGLHLKFFQTIFYTSLLEHKHGNLQYFGIRNSVWLYHVIIFLEQFWMFRKHNSLNSIRKIRQDFYVRNNKESYVGNNISTTVLLGEHNICSVWKWTFTNPPPL